LFDAVSTSSEPKKTLHKTVGGVLDETAGLPFLSLQSSLMHSSFPLHLLLLIPLYYAFPIYGPHNELAAPAGIRSFDTTVPGEPPNLDHGKANSVTNAFSIHTKHQPPANPEDLDSLVPMSPHWGIKLENVQKCMMARVSEDFFRYPQNQTPNLKRKLPCKEVPVSLSGIKPTNHILLVAFVLFLGRDKRGYRQCLEVVPDDKNFHHSPYFVSLADLKLENRLELFMGDGKDGREIRPLGIILQRITLVPVNHSPPVLQRIRAVQMRTAVVERNDGAKNMDELLFQFLAQLAPPAGTVSFNTISPGASLSLSPKPVLSTSSPVHIGPDNTLDLADRQPPRPRRFPKYRIPLDDIEDGMMGSVSADVLRHLSNGVSNEPTAQLSSILEYSFVLFLGRDNHGNLQALEIVPDDDRFRRVPHFASFSAMKLENNIETFMANGVGSNISKAKGIILQRLTLVSVNDEPPVVASIPTVKMRKLSGYMFRRIVAALE
ncbi:hypothetical protein H0H93_011240, partial [Arthromyces matolae]